MPAFSRQFHVQRAFTRLFQCRFYHHNRRASLNSIIPGRKAPIFKDDTYLNEFVRDGDNIYIAPVNAAPTKFVNQLMKHVVQNRKKVRPITVNNVTADFADPAYEDFVRVNAFFVGGRDRAAVNAGKADFLPVFLNETPVLFDRGIVKADVAAVTVSPADQYGYHSLGTTVVCTNSACIASRYIIGEINENMPRTFGETLIHESQFDGLIENNEPLVELKPKPFTDIERSIGKLIADDLIEDGSTLQMGIGGIPDAVLSACYNHKHLGIHSEMVSDGVIDLILNGNITNRLKIVCKDQVACTFIFGSKRLYDFINDNPLFVVKRSDFINHEFVIGKNPKVCAINSCLEIDLTGQIAADTLGPFIYSGFGGQVDFIRGAATSRDGKGKPIFALSSTSKSGASKIVANLKPGSSVTTTRAHVHYVTTEYGIAQLFGKNLLQRAYELIRIAHPDHRETLEKAAFERLKQMPRRD